MALYTKMRQKKRFTTPAGPPAQDLRLKKPGRTVQPPMPVAQQAGKPAGGGTVYAPDANGFPRRRVSARPTMAAVASGLNPEGSAMRGGRRRRRRVGHPMLGKQLASSIRMPVGGGRPQRGMNY